ncbi:MAG TPA: 30S ribosomal protein S4 [Candidatus Azoamicus sp. OHIO1]
MARFFKSDCKMSRRVGMDLGLKSNRGRDISSKCKLKVYPGQHGSKRKRIGSNYSAQLNAKQTIKYTYGLLEKQFRHFHYRVSREKGSTGELLLKLLESRLDNVVYRMGYASTRAEARQLVTHKAIIVACSLGERVVSIPSYKVSPGDIIKIRHGSKVQIRIIESLKFSEKVGFVDWVNVDIKNMSGIFIRVPDRKELSADINEQLVVELYTK